MESGSTTKVFLDSLAPDDTALVEMHLRDVSGFEAVNGFGKLFARSLIFDVFDGSEVCLEGKD
jgi:hypothetical protein